MTTLVLTAIGADRPGLVTTLAAVIARHGGSWERSQMSHLADAFAGIVVVEVPDENVAALTGAVQSIDGLTVTLFDSASAEVPVEEQVIEAEIVGSDRVGIIRELAAVFARHDLTIQELDSLAYDTPMSGGRTFEARVVVKVDDDTDLDALADDLEQVADELMVDLSYADDEDEHDH